MVCFVIVVIVLFVYVLRGKMHNKKIAIPYVAPAGVADGKGLKASSGSSKDPKKEKTASTKQASATTTAASGASVTSGATKATTTMTATAKPVASKPTATTKASKGPDVAKKEKAVVLSTPVVAATSSAVAAVPVTPSRSM